MDNKKKKITYTEEQKFLYNLFKFNEEEMNLKGTSGKMGIDYYGDYDFFTDIKRNYGDLESFEEFKKILNQILINKNLYFIEFKMQLKNGEKIKIFYGNKFKFDIFKKNFNNVDYCKIDLIIFNDNRFMEASCNYNFNYKNFALSTYKKEMSASIKEFIKDNNYFKVLRRIYSLGDYSHIKKYVDDNILQKINNFFNSEIGKKYRNISNIDAINLIKEYYDDALTKKRIESNLVDINFPIHNYMEKYEKEKKIINEESKKIYEEIKNRIEI